MEVLVLEVWFILCDTSKEAREWNGSVGGERRHREGKWGAQLEPPKLMSKKLDFYSVSTGKTCGAKRVNSIHFRKDRQCTTAECAQLLL